MIAPALGAATGIPKMTSSSNFDPRQGRPTNEPKLELAEQGGWSAQGEGVRRRQAILMNGGAVMEDQLDRLARAGSVGASNQRAPTTTVGTAMILESRRATQADVPAIGALMRAAIDRLQQPFLSSVQIAASHAVMGLDTLLINDGTYFVVESEGGLVGCGGWSRRAAICGGDDTTDRDTSFLDPRTDAARVRAMYTHPDFARRGIGRLVLERCQEEAAAEGFHRLELIASLAGRPLYESCGFEPIETLTYTSGSVAIPVTRMIKPIDDDEQ